MAGMRLAPRKAGIYRFFAHKVLPSACSLFRFQPGVKFRGSEPPELSDLRGGDLPIACHSLQCLWVNAQQFCSLHAVEESLELAGGFRHLLMAFFR